MKLNHQKKKKRKERKIVHLFCFRHFSEILEFNSLELTYMNRINDDC